VTNVLEKTPAPLNTLAPQHPKALDQIVTRLLAKRASDRFPSARELIEALQHRKRGPARWFRRPFR